MDESRPVEAAACHKLLLVTLSLRTNSTYRQNNHFQSHCRHTQSLLYSTKICLLSLFNSWLKYYKTLVKHFIKFLWHATQLQAFFAIKRHITSCYSYNSAKVNLRGRDWRKNNNTTSQIIALSLWAQGGHMVVSLETIGIWEDGGKMWNCAPCLSSQKQDR